MRTRRKLAIAALVVAAAIAYMAYVGVSAGWQYYLTVDECVAGAAGFRGDRVRVTGKIAPASLRISDDRREAAFSLVGAHGDLPVTCSGPLPDNLAENIDVVVEGRLQDSGTLRGDKVLTRCASKYEAQAADAHRRTAGRPATETRR